MPMMIFIGNFGYVSVCVVEAVLALNGNISEEKIEEACRAVGFHHFIKTLHNGYDTVLNVAINLSHGQKQ